VKALVIYESMYGNTRQIAEAIADGLSGSADVHLAPTVEAQAALGGAPDLVVIGGPTHAHGMTRPTTRQAAISDGEKAGSDLQVDPHAHGPGVRELLDSLGNLSMSAAAFDTRMPAPAWLSGRASKGIARALRRAGARLVAKPESFLVTKENRLVDGEVERARRWGANLAQLGSAMSHTTGGDAR
jgi:hypothetical protein